MDLRDIKGVGDSVIAELAKIDINSIEDLLDNYPRRYQDYSNVEKIAELRIGQVSIKAKIRNITARYVRRGMHITEAIASDGTGSVKLVWFNQPYRKNAIKPDKEYFISGQYDLKRSQFSITSPSIELVSDLPVNTARILPIYKETKTLKSTKIRKIYSELFKSLDKTKITEWLPDDIKESGEFVSRFEAIHKIHMPSSSQDIEDARKRLTFDELFIAMFASQLNKKELKLFNAPKLDRNDDDIKKINQLVKVLEFDLTDDQRRVAWQVIKDMGSKSPMNRILEGDVGSGKTMVALIASLFAVNKGMQVAVMSPTEILARQHFITFQKYLSELGLKENIKLLVGSQKSAEKARLREYFANGNPGILLGTHSLISKATKFTNLSLVVVDEQHRFGVDQRKLLQGGDKSVPHFLSMTATPIPRSLALTIFGELDISALHDKPPGRKPVKTKLLDWDDRKIAIGEIKKQLVKGHQAYVVCPVIDRSNSIAMKSVTEIAEIYTKELKDFRVAVIHGKIKSEEKESIMDQYKNGKIDVLVSTTVIEVGVDVPNSTVMVIESAERFGLAQIHQLRGRVGRSSEQGYCYLIPTDKNVNTYRLDKITQVDDGFKLAQFDLELRGPGSVYGSLQHGALDFRMVDISDVKSIERANQLAKKYVDIIDLDSYPEFKNKVQAFQIFTTLN